MMTTLLVLLIVSCSYFVVARTDNITFNDTQLDEYYIEAVVIIRGAGDVIRTRLNKVKRIQTKSSTTDFVTETDQEIENMIKANISSRFPDHKFIGEESAVEGASLELTNDPTWIIDPVDGTTNFIHGYPFMAISLALLINKETQLGIIYNPILDQLFTAQRGKGAFENHFPMNVSDKKNISEALLALALVGGKTPEASRAIEENFINLNNLSHGARSSGCAALDMAHVAMGSLDGFWHIGDKAWDIAAGDLLIREAGGVVMNTPEGTFNLSRRGVLCASTLELATDISSKLQNKSLLIPL